MKMDKDNKDILIVVILGLGILIGYISGQYDAQEDCELKIERKHAAE